MRDFFSSYSSDCLPSLFYFLLDRICISSNILFFEIFSISKNVYANDDNDLKDVQEPEKNERKREMKIIKKILHLYNHTRNEIFLQIFYINIRARCQCREEEGYKEEEAKKEEVSVRETIKRRDSKII